MSREDTELLSLIGQGDSAALAEYVQARRKPLLAFIEKRLGDALRRKVEAEDIFQEACADATRSLGQFDLGERDPFSWLCQIAERRIVDAHRRYFDAQKRDANRETPIHGSGDRSDSPGLVNWLVQSMTTPSQAFSRNVKQERLTEALAQLPDEQQEALRLRYVQGLPSKAIAEQLGKSDAAIRVMLTRSIKKLQVIFDESH